MLLVPYYWPKIAVFLVIASIGCYAPHWGSDKTNIGLLGIVCAIFAMAIPLGYHDIPHVSVNFLSAFCICVAISFVVLPDHIATQLRRYLKTQVRLLDHYIGFVLLDASLGNQQYQRHSILQELLFDSNAIFLRLARLPHKQLDVVNFAKASEDIIYLAVAVENALNNLSARAYFDGPLLELQHYKSAYHRIFTAFITDTSLDAKALLLPAQNELNQVVAQQLAVIAQQSPTHLHDYQQWEIVAFTLRNFDAALQQWIALYPWHGKAMSSHYRSQRV